MLGIAIAVLTSGALTAGTCSGEVSLTGYVGCHRLCFTGVSVPQSYGVPLNAPADWIAVTEVYPDTPEPVRYRYDVYVDGEISAKRDHLSSGFGPVTWFVAVPKGRAGLVRIVNRSPGPSTAPVIAGVVPVTRSDLDGVLRKDSFAVAGLISPHVSKEEADSHARLLAANLPERPALGIRRGMSYELRYATSSPEEVQAQIRQCEDLARNNGLSVLLGMVSWWSGTPVHVPDGIGGRFGDVTYQQVCYSPDYEHPHNEELKRLLGDRYSPNYGLSIPNQWSNCPWLTMNSSRLNEYRFSRLREAVDALADSGLAVVLNGLFLENEPRYWDTVCDAWNPHTGRRGKIVWADFNPAAVEAALKDGVVLDPNDGLSHDELAWLHRNVGRYNQDTVDAARSALSGGGLGFAVPLYTHSLQLRDMFPGGAIGHAASEWAFASGARTGLEGIWSRLSDFERVREWGRWANVNREENDGRPIDEHLWDLRVSYAMGADLYNSYNWHAIGEGRFFAYVHNFLSGFPEARGMPQEVKSPGRNLISIRTPDSLQAFDRIEFPVTVSADISGYLDLEVTDASGRLIGWSGRSVDLTPGLHRVVFDFAEPVESPSNSVAFLRLRARTAPHGFIRSDSIRVEPERGPIGISLDLRTRRALSLFVIERAERRRADGN